MGKVHAAPSQNINHQLTLMSESENVFACDVEVTALDDRVKSNNVIKIDYIDNSVKVLFSYDSIDTEGLYQFEGYLISYRLIAANNSVKTPGLIHYRIKSFDVMVNESYSMLDHEFKLDTQCLTPSVADQSQKYVLGIEQSVITPQKFIEGSLIQVRVQITNHGNETRRLLIVEGGIPTGTQFDTSTVLPSFITAFKQKESTVEFFITEIASGETLEFEYRLTALNLRASSLPAVKLSSMYDDWSVTSNTVMLGSSSVEYNSMGNKVTDVNAPVLEGLSYSQDKNTLSFVVKAGDENGIESVKVLLKDDAWYTVNLDYTTDTSWKGVFDSLSLTQEKTQVVVIVTDTYGNIRTSDPIQVEIHLPPELIPIVFIICFVIFSVLTAAGSATVVKKKMLKE